MKIVWLISCALISFRIPAGVGRDRAIFFCFTRVIGPLFFQESRSIEVGEAQGRDTYFPTSPWSIGRVTVQCFDVAIPRLSVRDLAPLAILYRSKFSNRPNSRVLGSTRRKKILPKKTEVGYEYIANIGSRRQ